MSAPRKREGFRLSQPTQTWTTEGVFSRAVDSPLVRGGVTILVGLLAGNAMGFVRVAVMAHLLGTQSRADSLAVAMGPLDTLNNLLINSMVFAFVPMLTACPAEQRATLFRKLNRSFAWLFAALSLGLVLAAPWLMRVLAPGLDPVYFETAVINFRIFSLSTVAAGIAAVHCALLYTGRRFAPMAFYQAALNVCTVAGALLLWKLFGVAAFAVGYLVGAWVQLAIVYAAARKGLGQSSSAPCEIHWRELLAKPSFFMVYAAGLGLNITFTRAYATHVGPGMAAALDYCMRGVGVPLALLVSPASNSLLPEIARLRSLARLKDAFRLIDRTIGLIALAAVGGCAFALLFREPVIALLFQHGNFTSESTRLTSAIFLGLGPSLVGWTLIEITARSLFALDRPWPPVLAATAALFFNVMYTLRLAPQRPEWIGVGASAGLMLGFLMLLSITHLSRSRWQTA
ncbi:MAG TPA: lipid II flippase MurJ [Verrucomicrobiae bacterium]|nr:lipid II flippase MurJ [Verrucomicrobiae bacterium]